MTLVKAEDASKRKNVIFLIVSENHRVPPKPNSYSHTRCTLIKIKGAGPRLGDVDFVNNLVFICNKDAVSYWANDSCGIPSYANFSLVVERMELRSGETYVTFRQIGVG